MLWIAYNECNIGRSDFVNVYHARSNVICNQLCHSHKTINLFQLSLKICFNSVFKVTLDISTKWFSLFSSFLSLFRALSHFRSFSCSRSHSLVLYACRCFHSLFLTISDFYIHFRFASPFIIIKYTFMFRIYKCK